MAFDILSGLGLIKWESHWFMELPHGTLALFPLTWTIMPGLMFIFIILDILLFWIIYRRFTIASDSEVALT